MNMVKGIDIDVNREIVIPEERRPGFVSGFQRLLDMPTGIVFDRAVGKKEQIDFTKYGIVPDEWLSMALKKEGGAEFLARHQREAQAFSEKISIPLKGPPKIKSGRYSERDLVPKEMTNDALEAIGKITKIIDEELIIILMLNSEKLALIREGKIRLHISQVNYLADMYWHSREDFFKRIGLGFLVSNEKKEGKSPDEIIGKVLDQPSPSVEELDLEKIPGRFKRDILNELVPKEIAEDVLCSALSITAMGKVKICIAMGFCQSVFSRLADGRLRLHISHVENLAKACGFPRNDFFEKIGLGFLTPSKAEEVAKTKDFNETTENPKVMDTLNTPSENIALESTTNAHKPKPNEHKKIVELRFVKKTATLKKEENISPSVLISPEEEKLLNEIKSQKYEKSQKEKVILGIVREDLTNLCESFDQGVAEMMGVQVGLRRGFLVGFLARALPNFSLNLSEDGLAITLVGIEGKKDFLSIKHLVKYLK